MSDHVILKLRYDKIYQLKRTKDWLHFHKSYKECLYIKKSCLGLKNFGHDQVKKNPSPEPDFNVGTPFSPSITFDKMFANSRYIFLTLGLKVFL